METKEIIKEKRTPHYTLGEAVACGFKKSLQHDVCGLCTATYNDNNF